MAIELTTVVTYPHRLRPVAINAPAGKQPTSFTEVSSTCPQAAADRPGGFACRQKFRITYPYAMCSFAPVSTAIFSYEAEGFPNAEATFGVGDVSNWCAGADVPAPQVGNLSPSQVNRGDTFTMQITGTHLDLAPRVKIGNTLLDPATVSGTTLTVVVPAALQATLAGLVPVQVITGGGASNTAFLDVIVPVPPPPVPVITNLSTSPTPPRRGGPLVLDITGIGLASGTTSVAIGSVSFTPSFVSDTLVTLSLSTEQVNALPFNPLMALQFVRVVTHGGSSNVIYFTLEDAIAPPPPPPQGPALAAAITAEIQPLVEGHMAYIQLTTVTTYPHRLQITDVTTEQGQPPVSFVELAEAASCPGTSDRPGGQECRQRFRFYYSYDTCQFDHVSVAKFRYTTGEPDVEIRFTNLSNNWCDETPVSIAPPVINQVSPGTLSRTGSNTVTIHGVNLNAGGSTVVSIGNLTFEPASASSSSITLHLPAAALSGLSGSVAVRVSTGGGASNQLFVNVGG